MDVTMTEKQWEEIWKYFGFSKKRRMTTSTWRKPERRTIIVDPNNKPYDWVYPEPTFENIYKWIFSQCTSWSIEKESSEIYEIYIEMYSMVYAMDDISSNEELITAIGVLLLDYIRRDQ